MSCRMMEITVRGEHHEIVTEAQPNEKGVDRLELHAFAPANVPDLGRHNVVFTIRHDHGQRCEPLYDRVASLRAAETLQQLLKHEPRRINGLLRCSGWRATMLYTADTRRLDA